MSTFLLSFFLTFISFEEFNETIGEVVKPYREQADQMRTNDRATLYVDFSHLLKQDSELAETILSDYYRHENSLRKGLQDFMFNLYPEYARNKLFNLSFFNLVSTEK
jgi:Predicted ATPase involved in replication control, Cdc46/Mcm family